MDDLNARLRGLADKEARLEAEIQTCIAYQEAMLAFTEQHGEQFEMAMIEDLLNSVYTVESDRRQHLLNIRFEKAFLSSRLK